jgi:hypothetical protein
MHGQAMQIWIRSKPRFNNETAASHVLAGGSRRPKDVQDLSAQAASSEDEHLHYFRAYPVSDATLDLRPST